MLAAGFVIIPDWNCPIISVPHSFIRGSISYFTFDHFGYCGNAWLGSLLDKINPGD